MKTKKTVSKKPAKQKELENIHVKMNFKKHLFPPMIGLIVALLIFGFFNSELISGRIAYYISSRHSQTQDADTKTTAATVDKNAAPKIIINKINVTAPVLFDQTTVDEKAFEKDLQSGVVHYPDTAAPGEVGNVVVFGHSSGQWWAPGDYKFIFTLLNKVAVDDKIFIEYKGVRYIYKVNNIQTVDPTDLSVLNQNFGHSLTLITCTPVGTSSKRLIVQAQQIVPSTTTALATDTAATQPKDVSGHSLPGSAPSFWDNFKALFN